MAKNRAYKARKWETHDLAKTRDNTDKAHVVEEFLNKNGLTMASATAIFNGKSSGMKPNVVRKIRESLTDFGWTASGYNGQT